MPISHKLLTLVVGISVAHLWFKARNTGESAMGDKNIDVAVVGSCMIDMICYTPRIPQTGETLQGSSFEMGNGGKGANQCVAANKLGAKTALVASLGNDIFGNKYLEQLKNLGVNVDHVKLTETHSGMAQITVTQNGENCIVIVPGANMMLSAKDVTNAHHLLLDAKVVVFQLETLVSTNVAALEYLKSGKCTTIFNAAPARKDLPDAVFRLSDIFCVNEIEAEQLSGIAVKDVAGAFEALDYFRKVGCNTVIITMGEKGIAYREKSEERVHLPVRKISPVDSTGAGDAFVGALAFYLSQYPDLDFKTIVERSAYIATESVLKKGTQSSYPRREDLPRHLFE